MTTKRLKLTFNLLSKISLSMPLLHLPPLHSLNLTTKPTKPTSQFLHGTTPFSLLSKPSNFTPQSLPSLLLPIKAMKSMQGRVVCATSDKTVAVEVTRLAPHPKYKRRVRKKKKYQAHDPDNVFKVGDIVQLEKCRPISKTKTFVAVPVPKRNSKKAVEEDGAVEELGIPLESSQLQA